MKQLVMIDIEQAGKTILNFIGTDDYNRIADSVGKTESKGFMMGLSIAYALLTTRCDRYLYNLPETVSAEQIPDVPSEPEFDVAIE